MTLHPSPDIRARLRTLWDEFGGKVLRYATGSVVAAVCSEIAFVALYGGWNTSPAVATGFGWLAGALPNYWLNRSWTWRRRGRPSLRGEVLPYVVIILVTLVVAALVTNAVDSWLNGFGVSHAVKVVLVAGAFLGVYGVMFLLRFFLLDKLFGHGRRVPAQSTNELISS
jgi:putative flippase GtrA